MMKCRTWTYRFVVAERALDHGEFFRNLVATGFDVSPEYDILAEFYLDGPWHFSFGASSNATRQEEVGDDSSCLGAGQIFGSPPVARAGLACLTYFRIAGQSEKAST